jgi:hypothetical protein
MDKFLAESKPVELSPPPEEPYAPTETVEEPHPTPSIGAQALDYTGRALDYGRGVAVTTAAQGAELIDQAMGGGESEKPMDIVSGDDWKNTFKGKAPSLDEYLRRMGVPEGGSLKFGDTKITARGAAGFTGDMAMDPLTAVAKLVKQIPYLHKLINAPGAASEALGEAIYKTATSTADAKLVKKGAAKLGTRPVGEALIDAGAPIGGAVKLAEKVNAQAQLMGKMRKGLYDRATELGVTIDTGYPLKRAEAVLKEMQENPGLRGAASELMRMMDAYKTEGKVSIDMLSKWKTQLYESLPKSVWGANGKLTTQAKKFKAALAADFRHIIVEAGNKAERGLGDSINTINDKWGLLLDATDPMTAQAVAASGKLGQMIDGAVLASGSASAYATKKAFDMAMSPYAKTLAGKALMAAGKNDLVNRAVRQSFAEKQRPTLKLPEEEE